MKELEKTKRISIAAVIFILAVIIGLLTYKRPKNIYAINTKDTLEKITSANYFTTLEDLKNPDYVLIDIRNQYEFDKGHLENAINIYAAEILSDDNSKVFKDLKEKNKTAVLYGNNPQEPNTPFLILYQLGFDNIKLLAVENSYLQNKLITKNSEIEKSEADITAFINESVKKANTTETVKKVVVAPPKKVITIEKKKKAEAEGGC
ncbi:MAG: rhodanese-like domain-containing protein [Lutibacter sp.]|jgi:rhodanese-related sulfurtransferase|nr:rhodanese-like domain-containing protein [Lutibacter sp.]